MYVGYNMPWLFNNFRQSGYYAPPMVAEKIAILNPQVLRYPGGTLANYHDSTKPGYGFEDTQATENYLSRLSYLLGQLPDVKISYVVNVYQPLVNGNINYWLDNMLNVLTKIPQIAYCEIGNEINISGEYMGVGDKPRLFQSLSKFNAIVESKANNYLQVSDVFIKAIKAHNPNIKIGLPMGNFEDANPRNKQWNKTLRTYGMHDAEIFHLYFTDRTYLDIKANFDKCVKYAQKPIWVTEWAYNHGSSGDKNLDITNEIWYKTYYRDFQEICRLSKKVEMICRHQLAGTNVYSVIKL